MIEKRVAEIKASLKTTTPQGWEFHRENLQGAINGALSILSLIYGPRSLQVAQFQAGLKPASSKDTNQRRHEYQVADDIFSALDAAIADFKAGLVQSERIRGKGEVLGDFVATARQALCDHSSEVEKVAAVLAAAALEEVLKQIGENLDVDVYNRDMRGVIQKLKEADALIGPQAGLALGYSQFRDKAFHGQFDQIDRGTIESALVFVDGLVQKHFA